MTAELTIKDISASGLGQSSPDDEVHKTSPYVLFELGGQEHKTHKEKKAGADVSWEGETIGLKSKAGESLTVSVIHKRHLLSDVVIGKGTLITAELGENGPVEVKLTEPKSGTPAGVITFTVSGNNSLGYPKTATIKGSAGDPPSTQAATAGFTGAGAEAYDPSGVKTGRAFPTDSDTSGCEGAGMGPGAAGAGGAAAAHKLGSASQPFPTSITGSGSGPGLGAGVGTGTGATTEPSAADKTYTETAKEKAVVGADAATQKLQDLKVGMVGQEGAAQSESKVHTGEPIISASAQASYVDKAKEAGAYLITRTQDALEYTKERLVGTAATGSPTAASNTTGGSGPSIGEKASAAADLAAEKASPSASSTT